MLCVNRDLNRVHVAPWLRYPMHDSYGLLLCELEL